MDDHTVFLQLRRSDESCRALLAGVRHICCLSMSPFHMVQTPGGREEPVTAFGALVGSLARMDPAVEAEAELGE